MNAPPDEVDLMKAEIRTLFSDVFDLQTKKPEPVAPASANTSTSGVHIHSSAMVGVVAALLGGFATICAIFVGTVIWIRMDAREEVVASQQEANMKVFTIYSNLLQSAGDDIKGLRARYDTQERRINLLEKTSGK